MKERKTALVLAGGGARGAYEAGVWQALTELGVEFDMVCGTSVGAINAAMQVPLTPKRDFDLGGSIGLQAAF